MKILFANNLCGYYGGVEQVIAHAARELAARGHECHLSYGDAGSDEEEFARAFTAIHRCSEFGERSGQGRGQSFADIAARVKPDAVFFHKVSRLPKGLEQDGGYRKVVLVHDHDLWCPTGLGYNRRNRHVCAHVAGWPCYLSLAFLERKNEGLLPFRITNIHARVREMRRYHHFDVILSNSQFIRDRLIANGFPPDRTHVCHPVLNQQEAGLAPPSSDPVILFVGSLIRGKGVDLLLRAASKLQGEYRVIIVGRGAAKPKLQKLADTLGISGAIHFAGWVPNEELPEYYRAARVVAIPSAWPEPFGLVGLEAMRHGRPAVAFRRGGIPDWLEDGETGLLVPPLDVAAFASALQRLLSDPALAREMGANGARHVREQFSFSRFVDQLEDFLAGLHDASSTAND